MKLHSEYKSRGILLQIQRFESILQRFESILQRHSVISLCYCTFTGWDPPGLFLADSPSIHTMSTRVYLGIQSLNLSIFQTKARFRNQVHPRRVLKNTRWDLNLQEREIYWTSTPVIIHLDDIVCISFTSYLINTNLLFIYLNMCFLCHLHLLQFSELITFVTIFVVDNICSCISQKLNVCSWIYSC